MTRTDTRIPRKQPIALAIGGSDSGGGAGIEADLKTFAAMDVHGTCAITCITAQNPKQILGIQPCHPSMVRRQIQAVLDELPPGAAKTGMLYSTQIIRVVAALFRRGAGPPLVVDPVMISGTGSRLLKATAVASLERDLLPRATLVTPNLQETEILLRRTVRSVTDMREAAKELHRRFGCAALVKGGHLRRTPEAADILFDGREEWLLQAPFIAGVRTHGTGCTYAAAITAGLALGWDMVLAVTRAKEHITQAIARRRMAAGHAVLNNFWHR